MSYSYLKDRLVGMLGAPGLSRLVASSAGASVVIVMMHRFSRSAGDYPGHDPVALKRSLSELRRAGVELVEVEQALDQFVMREERGNAAFSGHPRVAFTVDDGYADAVEIAGPVFAEFDCPVTCFVAPEIVDGREWYWWDKVDILLRSSPRSELVIDHEGLRRTLALRTPHDRRITFEEICALIKRAPADSVQGILERLAVAAEAELPVSAPSQFRVLDWNAMLAAEKHGWRFGAHSMTHPVMGQCTDRRAEWEISESISTVRARLANPSGVFCYPVGGDSDFGDREVEILRRNGVRWALSAIPGKLRSLAATSIHPSWQWRIPRFAHDERPGGMLRMFCS